MPQIPTPNTDIANPLYSLSWGAVTPPPILNSALQVAPVCDLKLTRDENQLLCLFWAVVERRNLGTLKEKKSKSDFLTKKAGADVDLGAHETDRIGELPC